jgi:nucleotide-binding universal stress UspA family protein
VVTQAVGLPRERHAIALHIWQQLSTMALAVAAVGPIWQAILDTARERDAAVVVMGARG